MSQYAIVIEGDGLSNYSAYAPELPGVAATGGTLDEAEAAMREAVEFHIEGLRLAGDPVPPARSHVALGQAQELLQVLAGDEPPTPYLHVGQIPAPQLLIEQVSG